MRKRERPTVASRHMLLSQGLLAKALSQPMQVGSIKLRVGMPLTELSPQLPQLAGEVAKLGEQLVDAEGGGALLDELARAAAAGTKTGVGRAARALRAPGSPPPIMFLRSLTPLPILALANSDGALRSESRLVCPGCACGCSSASSIGARSPECGLAGGSRASSKWARGVAAIRDGHCQRGHGRL